MRSLVFIADRYILIRSRHNHRRLRIKCGHSRPRYDVQCSSRFIHVHQPCSVLGCAAGSACTDASMRVKTGSRFWILMVLCHGEAVSLCNTWIGNQYLKKVTHVYVVDWWWYGFCVYHMTEVQYAWGEFFSFSKYFSNRLIFFNILLFTVFRWAGELMPGA